MSDFHWFMKQYTWYVFYTNSWVSICSVNTGLYAVHYARAFDGQNIHFDVKDKGEVSLSTYYTLLRYSLFSNISNYIQINFTSCAEQLI